jgi:hypothetical protein
VTSVPDDQAMRSRTRIYGMLAAATMAVGVMPAVARAAAAAPYCGIRWGSLAKSAPAMTQASVTGARVGRQDCYDRLVIDLAGTPAPGYNVRYIDPPYRAEGSGNPLFVAGGAVIQVTVHAPAYDAGGRPTVPWPVGELIVRESQLQAAGFRTFHDLVYGGSFEGYTSFGLGVRARLPFRVFQLDGPGNGTRLVIDVAHQW